MVPTSPNLSTESGREDAPTLSERSLNYPAPRPFTHAVFARDLARIGRRISGIIASETEGMGNPLFCQADARAYALSVIGEIYSALDWMELRIERHCDGDASRPASLVSESERSEPTPQHTGKE